MPENARMPTLGVIVPPADGAIPPELPELYGNAIRFVGRGLAIPQVSASGFDTVIDRVGELSRALARDGAQAIAFMGTSLSFYRGASGNDELLRKMREASGLPATTMSNAIVEGLRAVGARRLAVATAYAGEMNQRLSAYLEGEGFEVLGLEALELLRVDQIHAVQPQELQALGVRAYEASPGADSLLVSCGGLRTLTIAVPLEQRLGIPVVSSAVAGAWAAVRLLGHSGYASGAGRLLERSILP